MVVIYGEAAVAPVCAPLHICTIEIGPEKEFHETPSLSDPVRWQMVLREGFSGGTRRQFLILKPAEAAAVRARLEADRQAEAEAAAISASAVQTVTARTGVPVRNGLVAAGELNFDYLISGEAGFAPQRIYDDGANTHIELPRSWHGEHPVYHARKDEADRVVNYRIDRRHYEIKGVFETDAIRLGSEEIRIQRRQ